MTPVTSFRSTSPIPPLPPSVIVFTPISIEPTSFKTDEEETDKTDLIVDTTTPFHEDTSSTAYGDFSSISPVLKATTPIPNNNENDILVPLETKTESPSDVSFPFEYTTTVSDLIVSKFPPLENDTEAPLVFTSDEMLTDKQGNLGTLRPFDDESPEPLYHGNDQPVESGVDEPVLYGAQFPESTTALSHLTDRPTDHEGSFSVPGSPKPLYSGTDRPAESVASHSSPKTSVVEITSLLDQVTDGTVTPKGVSTTSYGTPKPTYPVTITPIGYEDDKVLSTGTSEIVSPLNVSTDEPESFGTVDSLSRGTGRPVTSRTDEVVGPGTRIPEISEVVDQTTTRHVSPEVVSPSLGTLKPFFIGTSEPVGSGNVGFQSPGTLDPNKSTPVDAVTTVPESLETFEPVDHETVRSTESNGERVEHPGTVSAPLDQGTDRPVDPSSFGPSNFTTSMPFSPGTIVPERSTPFDHITDVPTSFEAFRPTTRKPEDSLTETERPSSAITFKPVKPGTKTDRPAESDAGHSSPITPAVLEVTSLLDQVTDGTVTPEGISTISYGTPRPTYPVTITPIGYEDDEILSTGTSETVPPLNLSTDEPESIGTVDSLSRGTGRPVTSRTDEVLGPGTRIPEISEVVDQTTTRHVSPEVVSPSLGTLKPFFIGTSEPVGSGNVGFQGPGTLDPNKSTPVDAVTTVPESLETFEPVDLESVRSTESNGERVESPGTVSAPLDQGIDRPVDPSSFGPSSFTTSMPFSPGTIVPERSTPFDHITDGPTSFEVFTPTTRKPEDSVTETERPSSPITFKPVKPETKTDRPAESDAGHSSPITPAVLEVTSLLDQVTDGTVTPKGISTTSYGTPRPTYPVTITPIGYGDDEVLSTGTSETVPPLNLSTDEPESFGTVDSLSRGTGRPVTSRTDEVLGPGTRIPEISEVVDQTTTRHVSPEVISPSLGTLKPFYIGTSEPVGSGNVGFQSPGTLDPNKSTPADAVTTVPESLETFEPVDHETVRSTESNGERVESPGTVSAPLDQGTDRPVDPSSFGPSNFTTAMPFSPGTIVPERSTPFDRITDVPTGSEAFRPTTRKPEDSVTETERPSSPITFKPVKPGTKTDRPAESDAGHSSPITPAVLEATSLLDQVTDGTVTPEGISTTSYGTPRPTYPVTITPIGYGDDEVLSTGTSETVSPLNVSTDEPESIGTVDSLSRGTGRPVTSGNDEVLSPGTRIPGISAVVDQTTSRHVSPEVMSPTLGTLKPLYIVTSEPVESGIDGFHGPGTSDLQKSTPVDAVTTVPESLETFEPVDLESVRSTESNGEGVESPGTVSAPLDQGTDRPVDPSSFGPSSFTTSMPFSPGTIVPERSTPFDHITDVPTSSEAFRPTTRKPEDSVTETERPSSPITFKPVKPETKTDRPAESVAGHSTPITPAVLEVTSLLDQVTDGTVAPEGISATSYLTPRPTYPVTITPIGYEDDEVLITGTSETASPLNLSTDEPESFGTVDSLGRGTGRPVTSGNDELLGPGTRIPEISAVVDQTTSRHVSPEVMSPSLGTLKPLYIVTSEPVDSGIDGFQGPETSDPQKSTPVDAVTTVPESVETFEPVDLETVRSTESNGEGVESPGTVSAPLDQGTDRPVDPSSFGPSSFTTSMPFSPGTIVPERSTPFDHITDVPTSFEAFRPTARKPEDTVTETERPSSPITFKPVKPETKTDRPAESDAGHSSPVTPAVLEVTSLLDQGPDGTITHEGISTASYGNSKTNISCNYYTNWIWR